MRLLDWLLRTAMLVLACMATLAMIGSLASVSGGSLADAVPGRLAQEPAAAGSDSRVSDAEVSASSPDRPSRARAAELQIAPALQPSSADRDVARWLKALTYAVLAVAAFAAAAFFALLRIGSNLARIAER